MTDREIVRLFKEGWLVSELSQYGGPCRYEIELAIRRALLREDKRKQPKRKKQ